MIAIIDYDAGNIKSVEKAVLYLGGECVITRDFEILKKADKLILPGVGSFGDAMDKLNSYGLTEVIREEVAKGKPLLGICLGLQLLFDFSEENPGVKGLSLLPGKILRIPDCNKELKIPQIGWNSLHIEKESKLFEGIKENEYVYFVHSFYLKAEDESIVAASTEYGTHIHAAVESGNIFACQFHPEKSSDAGLRIIKNFMNV